MGGLVLMRKAWISLSSCSVLQDLSLSSIQNPRVLALRVCEITTEEDKFLKFPIPT